MSTVSLTFQDLGVIPVTHMTLKSMWMVLHTSKGRIFRTSFTMESGPEVLYVLMSLSILGIRICLELSHGATRVLLGLHFLLWSQVFLNSSMLRP